MAELYTCSGIIFCLIKILFKFIHSGTTIQRKSIFDLWKTIKHPGPNKKEKRRGEEPIKKGKISKRMKKLGGLVVFYGISNLIGSLMPNPVYTYTLNIWEQLELNPIV